MLLRLASLCSSKWEEVDGVRTLVPDEDARDLELVQAKEALAKTIEKAVAGLDGKPEEVDDENSWMYEMDHLEIASLELLREIPINKITEKYGVERIVFSLRPTPRQIRLNRRSVLSVWNRLKETHEAFVQENHERVLQMIKEEIEDDPENEKEIWNSYRDMLPIEGELADVNVVVGHSETTFQRESRHPPTSLPILLMSLETSSLMATTLTGVSSSRCTWVWKKERKSPCSTVRLKAQCSSKLQSIHVQFTSQVKRAKI